MLCKVTMPNSVQEIEEGTKLRIALCRDLGIECAQNINPNECDRHLEKAGYVGAMVDGQVSELSFRVTADCTAVPLTIKDYFGRHIVNRSAACLLVHAAKMLEPAASLEAGQSLHSQLFFYVSGIEDIVEFSKRLNDKFQELIAKELPFNTRLMSPTAALQTIENPDEDRRQLIHCWVGDRVGVVTVDGYSELAYGPFVPDTGFLRQVKVIGLPEGLLLACGEAKMPSEDLRSFMLGAARQAKSWNMRMNIDTVGKLDKVILDGRGQDLVQVSETFHELRIGEIARDILSRPNAKVVFVSGPSSSGKTSTVRRLSTHLQAMGKRTVYVGLDDYYRPAHECPRDEKGDYDFEALEAINVERIQHDLRSLVEGKETSIPHYDFVTQMPVPPEEESKLCLGEDQILLMEGIHGLNPAITGSIPKEYRYSLFVSALPQLSLDRYNRVSTTYARLFRRIIRDRRYRGISAADTIRRWPSVRRGENKYIFPYQGLSDAMFNSSLAYELAVFRTYAWPYLLEVPKDSPSYTMARDMLRFLTMVVPLNSEWVPKNSVLREFLGGSIYQY